jgi:hypothetical protein
MIVAGWYAVRNKQQRTRGPDPLLAARKSRIQRAGVNVPGTSAPTLNDVWLRNQSRGRNGHLLVKTRHEGSQPPLSQGVETSSLTAGKGSRHAY